MAVAFHLCRGASVETIEEEGLSRSHSADGRIYLSRSLDDARKWWRTFVTEGDDVPSLWEVDTDGLELSSSGYRALVCESDIPARRLRLLSAGSEPDWRSLDPSAHGISAWHKDTPDSFWERMRHLHGPDVGPR